MKRLLPLFFVLLLGCARAVPVSGGAAAENAPETRSVPILMYHSVLRDPARAGKYILSPDVLESDVRYLLENGYETVVLSDLCAFVEGRGQLPEKPVVLTFDDGYLNNLTYALPILERYDCRAVLSVVGAYTARFSETPDPNPNYAHVTWDDIRALSESGRFEIQNHSYDLHGQTGRMGSGKKRGESDAAYRSAFCADLMRLQTELTERAGVTPSFFAYPFGVIGPGSRELLAQMGFAGSLTCREEGNVLVRGVVDGLWGLGRYNRPSGVSTAEFMARVFE